MSPAERFAVTALDSNSPLPLPAQLPRGLPGYRFVFPKAWFRLPPPFFLLKSAAKRRFPRQSTPRSTRTAPPKGKAPVRSILFSIYSSIITNFITTAIQADSFGALQGVQTVASSMCHRSHGHSRFDFWIYPSPPENFPVCRRKKCPSSLVK